MIILHNILYIMNSTSLAKKIKLNNRLEMPLIDMGTYAIPDLDKVIYESIKKD